MSKWEPGERAVIVVSEWPNNVNRVVTLFGLADDVFKRHDVARGKLWMVRDGAMFDGWGVLANGGRTGYVVQYPQLMIAQWKLRLLDDDELTTRLQGMEYVRRSAQ